MKTIKLLFKFFSISLLLVSCNSTFQAKYTYLNKVPVNQAIIAQSTDNDLNNIVINDENKFISHTYNAEEKTTDFENNNILNTKINNNYLNKFKQNNSSKVPLNIFPSISAKHSMSQAKEMNSNMSLNWIVRLLIQVLVLALVLTLLGLLLPSKVFNIDLTVILVIFVIYLIFKAYHV